MASTSSKGKARKQQEEQHIFLSDLDILQSRPNYRIHVVKGTERGNPLKKDFLAYIEPATDESPERKTPVALYQGVWHSLKYTSGQNENLSMYQNQSLKYTTTMSKSLHAHITANQNQNKTPLISPFATVLQYLKNPLHQQHPLRKPHSSQLQKA